MTQRNRNTGTRKERKTRGQGDKGKKWLSLCLLASLSLWLCGSVAGSIQKGSFEKQALSLTREMRASELDESLPGRHFAEWFNEVVGPNAGVVWQLTECGEQIGDPGQPGHDLPACVEINATLSGGRKIFLAISVGTFKKGVTGKPSFFRAVIEQNERLHQVPRLRDLPKMLRAPADRSAALPAAYPAAGAKNQIPDLPTVKTDSALDSSPFPSTAPLSSGFLSGAPSHSEEPPPAPPPPALQTIEIIPESVSQSRAIARFKPDYPQTARKMNATGRVEVEIIISEAGLVLDAAAISGHLALRNAAVEAARKWVFEPARLYGEPVKVKSVLTFVFTPSAK